MKEVFYEREGKLSVGIPGMLKMNQSQGGKRGGPSQTLSRLANWGVPKLSGNCGVTKLLVKLLCP